MFIAEYWEYFSVEVAIPVFKSCDGEVIQHD